MPYVGDAGGTTQLIQNFRNIVNSRFARFILKKMTSPRKFEHNLAVFAGVEKARSASERVNVKIIESAIKRSLKTFHMDNLETVKEAFGSAFLRIGVSDTLRSVAKYGITQPQIFEAPLMIVWNLSKKCNLKCKHCYASAGPSKNEDEMTLEQKLKAVDILRNAGVAMIAFSGGEPLMSEDFWEVAEYAFNQGIYTTIATNGTLLTKSNVARLKKVGIKYIEVSLDSSDPDIHDEFRGIKGAWQKTVQGIKNAVEDGSFDIGIATTATRYNLDDIPKIIDKAIELKVGKLIVFNFVPTGRGKEMVEMDLSPEQREDLLDYLYMRWQDKKADIFSTSPTYSRIGIEKVTEGTGKTYSPLHFASSDYGSLGVSIADFLGGCGAGRVYAALEDNGDLEPCVFLPIRVGNILKKDFAEIWDESKVLSELRNREILRENCLDCNFRNACGGCRARAYGYYGNYLGPDPGCIVNKEDYEELLSSASLEQAGQIERP